VDVLPQCSFSHTPGRSHCPLCSPRACSVARSRSLLPSPSCGSGAVMFEEEVVAATTDISIEIWAGVVRAISLACVLIFT
jgi:hypothetical protein